MSTRLVELFSATACVDLVPGSTRRLWLTRWIPELVAAGVLVKRGKSWLGVRSEIVNALLLVR